MILSVAPVLVTLTLIHDSLWQFECWDSLSSTCRQHSQIMLILATTVKIAWNAVPINGHSIMLTIPRAHSWLRVPLWGLLVFWSQMMALTYILGKVHLVRLISSFWVRETGVFVLFFFQIVFVISDIHCPFLCSIIQLLCGHVYCVFIHITAKNVDRDQSQGKSSASSPSKLWFGP